MPWLRSSLSAKSIENLISGHQDSLNVTGFNEKKKRYHLDPEDQVLSSKGQRSGNKWQKLEIEHKGEGKGTRERGKGYLSLGDKRLALDKEEINMNIGIW